MEVHDSRGMVVVGLESSERWCAKCERMLPWADFAVDRSKPSGHKSYCRACDSKRVLAAYHARRAKLPAPTCSECGELLTGRQRVACSERCREARFKRLHPESYARREAAKVERRRERRREAAKAA